MKGYPPSNWYTPGAGISKKYWERVKNEYPGYWESMKMDLRYQAAGILEWEASLVMGNFWLNRRKNRILRRVQDYIW